MSEGAMGSKSAAMASSGLFLTGSDMYRLPQIADRLEVLADWQMGR